jgi:hypothetical protein
MRRAILLLPLLAAGTAAGAKPRHEVTPYIEVDQTAVAQLQGGDGDVLTYTTVAAGVTASVETRAAAIGADLRYERQFAWAKRDPDVDVLSGIATARVNLLGPSLSLEGGVLGLRARTDGLRGANANLRTADGTTQIYSAYAGPTYAGHIGDLGVNAAYRLGYNRVEDDVGGGDSRIGGFEDSWNHLVTGSVGMQPGRLPFGWAIGAGYERERVHILDQRFEQSWVRGDVTVPVSPTLALVGGVGYENVEIGNRDAIRDARGIPVLDSRDRYQTDKNSPRRLSYDEDGLIWDAGVLWRPSRRTSLEARVGRRYGSMSYTGSFTWAPGRDSSVQLLLFDSIDSFGRTLSGGLANVPTDFTATRNPFSGDLDGCVFAGGSGKGGACFNDVLSGIGTLNYRYRGLIGQFAARRGAWNIGLGLGYTRRRYIADRGLLASLDGLADQYWFGALTGGRRLDARSGINGGLYASYSDGGLPGSTDVLNAGGTVTYDRTLAARLRAQASLGLDLVDPDQGETLLDLLGQVGVRYDF